MTWTTRPRSEITGLAAITVGEGAPVLLLHGVGLRAEAWGAQLDGLSARMVAPDMPGHGASPPPGVDMRMEDYVARAGDVLAALDGPAVVVGHSMGAMLALALGARWPNRVRAVAALNAVFERSDAAAQAVQARAAALDGQSIAAPSIPLQRWFGDVPSPERTACAEWLTEVDPGGYRSAYTAFAQSRIPDRASLQALTCPALFMTGSAERNSTPAMSHAMAALAPRGRAHIVEGANHMMPMTHAAQVNAALAQIITEANP